MERERGSRGGGGEVVAIRRRDVGAKATLAAGRGFCLLVAPPVGGGDRIHPGNARTSG
jgi:hypothetical protein